MPPAGADLAALVARCTFPPAGTPVACAVSGGADSLALVVLACAAGCAVTAHHVDHGLREGSAAEADRVRAAARALGAGFVAHRVDVGEGPNLEARARAARYAVLPAGVCTGHTADDLAETVLLHLLRGAGLPGLAGMAPGVRHPLLALRRHETRAVCAAAALVPVDDPMNDDPRHARVRVRHEVLPLLDDVAARDVVPLLARTAGFAREATEALDAWADALDPSDARAVAAAPVPLARWALRRWLTVALGGAHPPDAAAVDRVLAVARGEVRAAEITGGHRVARTAGRLRVEHPPKE